MLETGEREVDYPLLLHQTYQEALDRNESVQKHWLKLKEEYSLLQALLKELPNELTKDVMVPVAPRALMRGKIAHSNEILVCLGQGYFVKRSAAQAAAICERREKICSDMLQSLQKERELFVARQELPLMQDAFSGEREIIEICKEEEHARWEAEHRQKEREYRQKLAELRTKGTAVVDEESLWKRLDELELEEELEEELDRLHADDSDDEEEERNEITEDICDNVEYEELHRSEEQIPLNSEDKKTYSTPSSRRVSFSVVEDDDIKELRIEFQHSSNESVKTLCESEQVKIIENPGQLYLHFRNKFLVEPKSILKKTNSYDNSLGNAASLESLNVPENDVDIDDSLSLPPTILQEVVERDLTTTTQLSTCVQPISRFKAMRQKNKRK